MSVYVYAQIEPSRFIRFVDAICGTRYIATREPWGDIVAVGRTPQQLYRKVQAGPKPLASWATKRIPDGYRCVAWWTSAGERVR
jgi:hypothetical protein